ncbi:Histone-lysine N-methyltransferase SUV39H1 [Fasciolopsis buskii]|uniref:Histone-lysine N-methyltransferase n=1 Tax=Fasciolopsis buskii TaxID=27845 RepID=A0A8E0S9Z1_9TREM|nr:Histone-lysine N-methyltransferase SUV39H1 [Fasciolopsis buski]
MTRVQDQTYYHVKWEGWPSIFNTWEPDYNLIDCKDAINNFLANCNEVGVLPSEARLDKRIQVKEVIDRLREAAPCSLVSPFGLLQRFLDLQPPSLLRPRIYREPSICRHFVGGSVGPLLSEDSLKRPASDSDFILVNSKRMRQTKKDKQVLRLALQVFEQKLNSIYHNEAPITVENRIDSECPPVDFLPIPDYCPGQGVFLPNKSPVGCDCSCKTDTELQDNSQDLGPREPCWDNRRQRCCPATAGAIVPYNRQKRLVAPVGHPVYECNSACSCGSSCPFRVVQLGRRIPLCVFRTRDRGWGVKTMSPIARGTFVTEYLGEAFDLLRPQTNVIRPLTEASCLDSLFIQIIPFDEAEKRGLVYDKQTMTYLFDLDFEGDAHYTVDASQMGNISHFLNHSVSFSYTV